MSRKFKKDEHGARRLVGMSVQYPEVRAAARKGELTAAQAREIEREIAADLLEQERPKYDQLADSELMGAAHRSDKAKRAADTRKRNAAAKPKAAARDKATVSTDLQLAAQKHHAALMKSGGKGSPTVTRAAAKVAKLEKEARAAGLSPESVRGLVFRGEQSARDADTAKHSAWVRKQDEKNNARARQAAAKMTRERAAAPKKPAAGKSARAELVASFLDAQRTSTPGVHHVGQAVSALEQAKIRGAKKIVAELAGGAQYVKRDDLLRAVSTPTKRAPRAPGTKPRKPKRDAATVAQLARLRAELKALPPRSADPQFRMLGGLSRLEQEKASLKRRIAELSA